MFDFIVERLGFWAFICGMNVIGAVSVFLFLFTKLEKKVPNRLKEYVLRFFVVCGVVSLILFLVALGIRSW